MARPARPTPSSTSRPSRGRRRPSNRDCERQKTACYIVFMKTDLDRATALSERLVAARRHHRRAEHSLAVLLTELATEELFRPLGYVSLEDYAGSVLEISARHARELVRIGRALPGLPKLAATFAAGELDWTKARELVRVATEATEEAWLQRARDVPCRILERQVAARSLGQLPPEGNGPHELAPERRARRCENHE